MANKELNEAAVEGLGGSGERPGNPGVAGMVCDASTNSELREKGRDTFLSRLADLQG